MYCPSCRAQFREGFFRCEDCDVKLVEDLPPKEEKRAYVHLVTVFTEGEIALIKSRLEQTDIDYYFEGEQSHRLAPLPLGVRLMVREDCREEAEVILSDAGEL
ncbi:MAG: putative signal transducing protein [Desulfobulbales bacterium]